MKPKDNGRSSRPEIDNFRKDGKKDLPLGGSSDDLEYGESYILEQKKKARQSREKIEESLQRLKRLKRGYPWPESAHGLPAEQISRRSPLYLFLRWEFYFSVAAFVMAVTYFPWVWVADWAIIRLFVIAIEQLVVSIDSLPLGARHLPVDPSKAHLSIIHLVGMVTLVFRLSTQRSTFYREVETWRYFVGFFSLGIYSLFILTAILFWPGSFPDGEEYRWHTSLLQVSITLTVVWLCQIVAMSWAWSYLKRILAGC